MKTKIFSSLVFFFSLNSFAAPVITGATGLSRIIMGGQPVLIGGMAGDVDRGDGYNTLDNCETGQLVACNTHSVYGSLQLTIRAENLRALGNLLIARADGLAMPVVRSSANSVSITWDALCYNLPTGGTNCATFEGTASAAFKLFTDENLNGLMDANEQSSTFFVKYVHVPYGYYDLADGYLGLTDFKVYPGDEKVYIEEPVVPAGNLFMPWGAAITHFRVYPSPMNMIEAAPGLSMEPKDLEVTVDGITDGIVDDLVNGQLTFFRIGQVDEAGNVTLFLPGTGEKSECDNGEASCAYSATPEKLAGRRH